MSTTATTLSYEQERAHLLHDIALLQERLARVRAELTHARATLFARNIHRFTLTFVGGQVALLEVRGAADDEQARILAANAIKHCHYMVTDGDTTYGQAQYFYYWCSLESQVWAMNHQKEEKRTW